MDAVRMIMEAECKCEHGNITVGECAKSLLRYMMLNQLSGARIAITVNAMAERGQLFAE